MKNNLFIISGPSGAGEDSVIEGLIKKGMGIERVITSTTRSMRPGESQGNPYYFISETEFVKGINQGDFVEYAQQYNGKFYGVNRGEIDRVRNSGKIGIWKIEYQGVMAAKKIFPGIKAILIWASIEVLEDRLRKRGGLTEEEIRQRSEYTREWLNHRDIYDYEVENVQGELDETIEKVEQIVKQNIE